MPTSLPVPTDPDDLAKQAEDLERQVVILEAMASITWRPKSLVEVRPEDLEGLDVSLLSTRLEGILVNTEAPGRERVAVFLLLTAMGVFWAPASTAAEVSWAEISTYTSRHPSFSDLYKTCQTICRQIRVERADAEIYRRGLEGYDEDRYGKDGFVGTVTRYSDRLALAFSQAHDERYAQTGQPDPNAAGMQVTYNIIGVEPHLPSAEIDRLEALSGRTIDIDGNEIEPGSGAEAVRPRPEGEDTQTEEHEPSD